MINPSFIGSDGSLEKWIRAMNLLKPFKKQPLNFLKKLPPPLNLTNTPTNVVWELV
jgi:hypothetical protein